MHLLRRWTTNVAAMFGTAVAGFSAREFFIEGQYVRQTAAAQFFVDGQYYNGS